MILLANGTIMMSNIKDVNEIKTEVLDEICRKLVDMSYKRDSYYKFGKEVFGILLSNNIIELSVKD